MKVLLYTDNHFSQYSSILRNRGERYSIRLENQIKSINWVERLAAEEGCTHVFCLGDFFDKATLTAEEITALKDIKWNENAYHYFIVGNHEMGTSDLTYSTAHVFESLNFKTFKFVELLKINDDVAFVILPYLTKDRRNTLKKYIEDLTLTEKANNYIVLSHNDIAGIRYGQYMSKDGFDIQDIYDNCRLFINGHLHNQTQINDKTLNLGNLTGQNFSEDALKHSHCAAILDTDDFSIKLIVNPFALNFYKFEIYKESDIDKTLSKCLPNSVLSIKANQSLIDKIKEVIPSYLNIIQYRIVSVPEIVEAQTDTISELINTDHIQQFKYFILSQIDNTTVLAEELSQL